MSVATAPPPARHPQAAPTRTGAADACPLCRSALASEQDWCLQCGAAARTRLAASPNWAPPAIGLAVVIALALAVLAASLVKLAGDSGSSPPAITHTVTVPAAASTTSPATTAPSSTTGTRGHGVVIPKGIRRKQGRRVLSPTVERELRRLREQDASAAR